MAPTITPLDASFGAVVTDIKIATMTDAEWQATSGTYVLAVACRKAVGTK